MPVVHNVTCLGCGCSCDDIALRVEDNALLEAKRACELGRNWFASSGVRDGTTCWIDGQSGDLSTACDRAATILSEAQVPLVCGLTSETVEAQRQAVAIADRIGAYLDTGSDAASLAMQTVGLATATWGEVAQRADAIVFWRCDPASTHPRHLERYSAEPVSEWLPRGRADRYLIVVDSQKNATSEVVDESLPLSLENDLEAIGILRAIVRDIDLDPIRVKDRTGVSLEKWRKLAARLQTARYGAFFYGSELKRAGHAALTALFSLIRELNEHARCVLCSLGSAGNAVGAEQVATWQTGFPGAIRFSSRGPEYSPEEFTAENLLVRGEVDVALIVADGNSDRFSHAAQRHLAQIPTIVLRHSSGSENATVCIATAMPGVSAAGTIYRGDGIALPLRPPLASSRPTAAYVLQEIDRRIKLR